MPCLQKMPLIVRLGLLLAACCICANASNQFVFVEWGLSFRNTCRATFNLVESIPSGTELSTNFTTLDSWLQVIGQ